MNDKVKRDHFLHIHSKEFQYGNFDENRQIFLMVYTGCFIGTQINAPYAYALCFQPPPLLSLPYVCDYMDKHWINKLSVRFAKIEK